MLRGTANATELAHLALPQPQVPFIVLRAVRDLEGTVPHACMATASECDGHRDRENRDQHGLPGLARAVFVCHSHTVAASSAVRLPPAGDIAASLMRVADRRYSTRALPPARGSARAVFALVPPVLPRQQAEDQPALVERAKLAPQLNSLHAAPSVAA